MHLLHHRLLDLSPLQTSVVTIPQPSYDLLKHTHTLHKGEQVPPKYVNKNVDNIHAIRKLMQKPKQ